MSSKKLKPYMVYDAYPEEGAILVFHYTAKEARSLGFPTLQSWFDTEWIHVLVSLLKEPWHYVEKQSDEPHVIENPKVCRGCELWGLEPSENPDYCIDCYEDRLDIEHRSPV